MDKLLRNNWFVKLISFLIALMLFTVVYSTGQSSNPFGIGSGTRSTGSGTLQQSQQIPLTANYNQKKYVLANMPTTVTVDLQGSGGLLTKVSLAKDYQASINLKGKGPGTYTVPVTITGVPSGIKANPVPAKVTVTLSKKVSKTFPVQIDLINENQVASGYEVGTPIVSPNQVKVTTSKDNLHRIAFVEGLVDVKKANNTIEKTVSLNVYDHQGNQLNVNISPSVVKVKVPITGDSKTVPVQVQEKGKLPDGLSIASIQLKPSDITLFGSKKTLDNIGYVNVPVDLNNINQNTTMKLEIPKPDGVNQIAPKKVTAVINVTKQDTQTFSGIPITVYKSDGQKVSFINPSDQKINVTLVGSKQSLSGIKSTDIQAYIDVSGLSTGEHSVPIQFNSPKSNVTVDSNVKEAKIDIK